MGQNAAIVARCFAAALRGNEREDAARDIIVTIPMDKLSSEERALIEAK